MFPIRASVLCLLAAACACAGQDPSPTSTSTPTPTYQHCGGHSQEPNPCPSGYVCIDDPDSDGCGMACDMPGICVDSESQFCGGIAGIRCEDGKTCIDYPDDGCDPMHGGADCGGICV